MLIIYHSRNAFAARQAALLHVGRLSALQPASSAQWLSMREALGGDRALQAAGLWPVGDGVYALGRASRAGVVEQAFAGMASLFSLDSSSCVLQAVGQPQAWTDIASNLLRAVGLTGLACRVDVSALQRSWQESVSAVGQVRRRLGGTP